MNEQQTRELAKQYRERAAIMEAAKWVDGKCVNIDSRRLRDNFGVEWFRTNNPCWYFEDYEYRIVEPDEVMYYAWINGVPYSNTKWDTLNSVREFCRKKHCTDILKVTTKPDGTKDAEFIEVGK
jgi:hypothetical protein